MLAVPSAIIPTETNYLLNPLHPGPTIAGWEFAGEWHGSVSTDRLAIFLTPASHRTNIVITRGKMKTTIRKMGNSQGVIIPKPLLAQVGFEGEAEMAVENDAIVLRKPQRKARAGWAEASKTLATSGDDALVWPEFGNEADEELAW